MLKNHHAAVDAVEFLRCPLSGVIPADPVVAEDGYVYERDKLLFYFEDCLSEGCLVKSPVTSTVMGTRITSSPAVLCVIENLMASETLCQSTRHNWEGRFRWENTRCRARKGDTQAMKKCGRAFRHGDKVVKKRKVLSAFWRARADIMREVIE